MTTHDATATDYANDPLNKLLNDAGHSIPYRPVFRELVGDIKAAILLQQIVFRHITVERRAFYKFVSPCEHLLYKNGDSWIEELGFSVDEYNTALKKIATKTTAKKGKRAFDEQERLC